jgi:hypothetical protein
VSSSPVISKVQQKAIQKADTLIEALGWIRKFRDTTTVITTKLHTNNTRSCVPVYRGRRNRDCAAPDLNTAAP